MSRSTQISRDFAQLCAKAATCRACVETLRPNPILSNASGLPAARVMLVGEAPGRLGAAKTDIPFHGDESGRRLDRLVAAAGWTRADLFITNAVLCNPLDGASRNRPPRARELRNCSAWLARQLDVIDPLLVVALGAVALRALHTIEPHEVTLQESRQEPVAWSGRFLAARYHPSARAAIHRPVDEQVLDFEVLGRWLAALSVENDACR